MKTTLSLSLLLLGSASVAAPAFAQTTAAKPAATAHRATTTAPHSTVTTSAIKPTGGCATGLPTISPKIPALPASAGCPKALYTISRKPDISVDYLSPLVGPEVRAELDFAPTTFTLAYVDSVIGTGAPAKMGQYLSVKYTGYTPDGNKFDSSYDHPGAEPLPLAYGQHKVIQGWDTGFEGMKVGGKRRLIIPYQLAYGEAGHPPVIPAKSWLVFDLELVDVSATPPQPKAPPAPPAATTQPAAKPTTAAPKQ